jgi:hypothetical protein
MRGRGKYYGWMVPIIYIYLVLLNRAQNAIGGISGHVRWRQASKER